MGGIINMLIAFIICSCILWVWALFFTIKNVIKLKKLKEEEDETFKNQD